MRHTDPLLKLRNAQSWEYLQTSNRKNHVSIQIRLILPGSFNNMFLVTRQVHSHGKKKLGAFLFTTMQY